MKTLRLREVTKVTQRVCGDFLTLNLLFLFFHTASHEEKDPVYMSVSRVLCTVLCTEGGTQQIFPLSVGFPTHRFPLHKALTASGGGLYRSHPVSEGSGVK